MARKIVTLQTRRGNSSDFDATKMLSGEVATVEDTEQAYISFADGTAEELALKRDIPNIDDIEIPDALPNPHALTFTGAVSASYDGSKAVTVNIPTGGGGGGTGTTDHAQLTNRDAADQHPISAITGLQEALDNKGADGVGISSIEQTVTSEASGGVNVVTVTKTDGSLAAFEVRNGAQGEQGDTGAPGSAGIYIRDPEVETVEQALANADAAGATVFIDPSIPDPTGIYVRDPETETVEQALANADAAKAKLFIDPEDTDDPEYITTDTLDDYLKSAGIYIERDGGYIAGVTTAAGTVTAVPITFKKPFSGKPLITPVFYSGSAAAGFGNCVLSVINITTTGCTINVYNGDTSGRSPGIIWEAKWWSELGEDMYV